MKERGYNQLGHNSRKQMQRGSLTAVFQYVPTRDKFDRPIMDDREPGVIIVRTSDIAAMNRKEVRPKVIIGLTQAWKYGIDSYVMQKGLDMANHLGLGGSRFELHNFMDFLQDMLIHLVTMKPENLDDEERPNLEVQMRNGGMTIVADDTAPSGKKLILPR